MNPSTVVTGGGGHDLGGDRAHVVVMAGQRGRICTVTTTNRTSWAKVEEQLWQDALEMFGRHLRRTAGCGLCCCPMPQLVDE